MRILIFGAGAVGQGVGAFLAASGQDVALLVRPRYLEPLGTRGLDVHGVLGHRHADPDSFKLLTDSSLIKPGSFDAVFLCVKSYDTPSAAATLRSIVGKDTVVVSMQNGYENVDLLASELGRDRVLCGRVITGFIIPEPGKVDVTVHADDILIGSFYTPAHPAAVRIADALRESGLPCRADNNVEAALWGKILYNCALNPLGAILRVHYGALGDSHHTRAVMDAIIAEAFEVIHHYGFPCIAADADSFRGIFYSKQLPATYHHRPSMLQDLESGKRTEIDALNGAIVRLASGAGLSAPVNQTMVGLVHFMQERGASHQ